MEKIVVVNPNSTNAKSVIDYLKSRNIQYFLINHLEKKIKEGNTEFVICGGDGTIHHFVNTMMKFPKKRRNSIKFGVVPCGRANDLARYMKLPLEIEQAFNKIKDKREKKIDLIKVNESYVITGGGIGLPCETVQNVDKFSSSFLGKYLKKSLGDLAYLIFTLKKFIFGYNGVNIQSKNISKKIMAIYILNQSFLGKRFNLAPEAKNDDGLLDILFVENPPTFYSHLKTLSKGLNGKLTELKWVKSKKSKKISIELKEPLAFMGDGELLRPSTKFNIEIISKAITLFT